MAAYLLGAPRDCWIKFHPLRNSAWCCAQTPLRDSISLSIRHTNPEFSSISQSKWKMSAPKGVIWCPFDTVATGKTTLLLKAAFLQNFKNISLSLEFNICTEWNTIISTSYPFFRPPHILTHLPLSFPSFSVPLCKINAVHVYMSVMLIWYHPMRYGKCISDQILKKE